MSRLKRVDCSGPGIRRRRRGKGFEYLDDDGRRVTEPTVLERIRELAISPDEVGSQSPGRGIE